MANKVVARILETTAANDKTGRLFRVECLHVTHVIHYTPSNEDYWCESEMPDSESLWYCPAIPLVKGLIACEVKAVAYRKAEKFPLL